MRRKLLLTSFVLGTLLISPLVYTASNQTPTPQKVDTEDPYVLMELFGAAYSVVKSDYVEPTEDKKLIENAINGMLSSLDPHSGFMDEDSFNELDDQTKGEFGGLGLEVSMENGIVRVTSPIDDTPAFKANLQAGDYITHIDDESVMGGTLMEAVKKMRGKPNTKVKLTISRGKEEPFDVVLTRAIIKVDPVKSSLKDDIGYIRIITFGEKTTSGVKDAVASLKKQAGKKGIAGYVLDVRNNPGGLLNQAIDVADLFLDKGEIVSTRSRKPEDTQRFSAKKGDITDNKPMVILINEGSASASEILAGALQDHKRAVVVGLKSFGKGSVQAVRAIPGFGGIRMTVARYYTPSGNSIQATGIIPDVKVPRAKLEEQPEIKGFAEANLPKAIAAEEGKKAKEISKKISEVLKDKKTDTSSTEEKEDYQLDRALDILHGIAVYNQRKES